MAEGSAEVALRMAGELGHRIRYATPVVRVEVARADALRLARTFGRMY